MSASVNDKLSLKVRESLKKINLTLSPEFDAPLAELTTFKVGGPADIMVSPTDPNEVVAVLSWARAEGVPVFLLGGGANIVVSDKGVRGLVIRTDALSGFEMFPGQIAGTTELTVRSGMLVSELSAQTAEAGLKGLDFIYSMPGSVGGAVYMNARCYGSEISDILLSVDYVDNEGPEPILTRMFPQPGSFLYKDTPFMKHDWIIVSARMRLGPGDRDELWKNMRAYEADRRSKGHFAAPCAGSVFKNNHAFGAPSGKIIDSVGLRGLTIGGAKVSDFHANIIVNTGNALAADIRALMNEVHRRVLESTGFDLEAEVELAGDW